MRCDDLKFDQLLGELDGLVPIGGGRLKQEGLLEDQLVLGILGERPRIEIGGSGSVVVVAGNAAGEIIAKQRAGAGFRLRRPNLRIGRRGGQNRYEKECLPPP